MTLPETRRSSPLVRALVLLMAVAVAGLALTPGAAPTLAQVVVPPTVLTVVAPTDVPPEPTMPTQPPPTSLPPAPPTRDSQAGDEDDEPEPPSAPTLSGQPDQPTPEASPTRTRRPTRTPRTTPSPSPTPMVAGGLRLTLSSEPMHLVSGGRMELLVRLANQTDLRAVDLTLQVVLPDSVLVDAIDAGPGLFSRSGPYLRWYLPGLDPGRSEELRLGGVVARAPAEGVELCALLLSGGAPVEHCSVLPATQGEVGGAGTQPTSPPVTDEVGAVVETGRVLDLGALGWGVLLLGLGALGVALGLRRRAS